MTREEIVEQLNLAIGLIKQNGWDWLDDRDIPMLEECVKALENHDTFMKYAYSQGKQDALSQKSCDVFDKYGNYKYPSDVELTEPNTATSMPCDDAISRNAVIDAIRFGISNIRAFNDTTMIRFYERENEALKKAIERVNKLPSVTQKSGKWIGIDEEPHEDYECSCCGYVVSTFTANIEPHTEYKYCPNCGCRMVEPRESEE